GLDKPAGEPASATFQLAQDEESVRLSEIDFRSGAIRIEGEAEFARGGGLVRLDLPVVRTARGTDVSVTGSAQSGTETYSLSGAALDLRPVLRGFNGRDAAAAPGEGGSAGGGRYQVE